MAYGWICCGYLHGWDETRCPTCLVSRLDELMETRNVPALASISSLQPRKLRDVLVEPT